MAGNSRMQTLGNNSYISLDLYGHPNIWIDKILECLFAFEKDHPTIRIVNWNLQIWNAYTNGIWIQHEMR